MVYPRKEERNRRVVAMRAAGMTLKAIARIEGVTHQRVSAIYKREMADRVEAQRESGPEGVVG